MIYCVEDDRNIRELILYTLETSGFQAKGFADGTGLIEQVKENQPELILLDIMLPGQDGIEILKTLKSSSNTKDIPVIMVSAKGAEYDKVMGLDLGADDYIAKPFGMMEFIARVKAVLRRNGGHDKDQHIYQVGDISIHVERHQVFVENREISLTLKEFQLLKYLAENQGIVLTRDQLLEHIWGYDFDGETRTVDVHIRTLRQKLGTAGTIIETIRGVGYRIDGKGKR